MAKKLYFSISREDFYSSTVKLGRLDIVNDLNVGDTVTVVSGPFINMYGKILSIDLEKQSVEVALDLFGQETSVELELAQIKKTN